MTAALATGQPSPGRPTAVRPTAGGPIAGRGRFTGLGRWLAVLVLPASIVPVLFLGPTLLRAPHRLWRQAGAEIQRLEGPSHHGHRPATVSRPLTAPAAGALRRVAGAGAGPSAVTAIRASHMPARGGSR